MFELGGVCVRADDAQESPLCDAHTILSTVVY